MCIDASCSDMQPCTHVIRVTQPDDTTNQSTHTALLDLPHLPLAIMKVYIFPSLANKSLLSLSHFCDNGYVVQLTAKLIHLQHPTNPSKSLFGDSDRATGMWLIDITSNTDDAIVGDQPHHLGNSVYEYIKSKTS